MDVALDLQSVVFDFADAPMPLTSFFQRRIGDEGQFVADPLSGWPGFEGVSLNLVLSWKLEFIPR